MTSSMVTHKHLITPSIAKMVMADIPGVLNDADKAYFVESREKRFGISLSQKSLPIVRRLKPQFKTQLDPFRRAMAKTGWISWAWRKPGHGRLCPLWHPAMGRVSVQLLKIIDDDDVIATWMEKMLDLHDGLGRKTAAAS